MVFQITNLCFLLLILNTFTNGKEENYLNIQFQFNDIKSCKNNEFYDLNEFKCFLCHAYKNTLETSADSFSCTCKKPTQELVIYDSFENGPICAEKCQECIKRICKLKYVNITDTTVKTTDKKHLQVTHYNPYFFNSSYCNPLEVEEIEQEKACNKKWNMRFGDFCIYSELLQPYVKYSYFWQAAATNFINEELKFISFLCLELQNNTACQHLANLCIISHFSSDKNSPCHVFLMTQSSTYNHPFSETEFTNLHKLRPLLFFSQGKETEQLLKNPLNVSSLNFAENEQINFFSTTYKLIGKLRRWGPFQLNHIDLCCLQTAACATASTQIRFAKSMRTRTCTLTLENLIDYAQNQANDYFLSIFLNFTISTAHGKKIILQTIPILIEDSMGSNKRYKESDWQLVTRFLPIEAQPRRHITAQLPTYEDSYKLSIYQSIRFVEHLELHYTIYAKNCISLPYIKLHYRHVDIRSNSTLRDLYNFSYAVTFTYNNDEDVPSYILQDILLPLLLLFGMGVAGLHTYNYKLRHVNELSINCDTLVEFLLELLSQISHVLLIYALLFSSYIALKYHMQYTNNEFNHTLYTIINLAFLLKLIFCGAYFFRQTSYNLYFIDWERPKLYNNNLFNLKCNLDTSSVCSSARTQQTETNVSAWRMIMLANSWIRVSSQIQTSMLVRAILLLIIYHFTAWSNFSQNLSLLSLYTLGMLYAVIYVIQKLWCWLIKDQLCLNPLGEFSRICSLSNISIFALLDRLSYGYYVHGRSPHGFADTDVHSLLSQLQRDPKMNRGLLSDSDQQHYLVLPPINLRTYLGRLVLPLQGSAQAQLHRDINTVESQLERHINTHNSINRFLCAFIDHAIKDMDYIIKEKNLLEQICHCEYDNFLTDNKGTFYIDNSMEFGRILLYGNDFHVFVLTLLMLLSLFMQIKNITFCIILVMLFHMALEFLYRHWTRENLIKNTSIDKRLLI